jgi:hypothetical protein
VADEAGERPNLSAAARARELRRAWLGRIRHNALEEPGAEEGNDPDEQAEN